MNLASLFEFKRWANAELADALVASRGAMEPEAFKLAVRIANHTHVVDRIFQAHLEGRPHPYTATNTPETPTPEALKVSMAEVDGWLVDFAGAQDEASLARVCRFTFTDGDAGEMNVGEILLHLIAHGAYHRGAAGRVLKEANLSPPRELLTRFLHEREPERRTR
jgi:uncharacterized damage-inducible protein DinB